MAFVGGKISYLSRWWSSKKDKCFSLRFHHYLGKSSLGSQLYAWMLLTALGCLLLCLGSRFAEWHWVRFIKGSMISSQYFINATSKVNRNQEGDIERCSSQFSTVWWRKVFYMSHHESIILALGSKFQYSLVRKGQGGSRVFIWSWSVVCFFNV